MVTSLTGPYTPLGTNDKLGAEQAVAGINRAGGIDGRQLQLTVLDDQTNPTQAVIDIHQLIGDGVVAIDAPVFSSSAMAVLPVCDSARIACVANAAADSLVQPVHRYMFMTPPTTLIVAQQLLAYMQAKRLTRMAVARDTSAFPTAGWDNMRRLAPRYGVHFVADEIFSLTTTDFSAILTHVRASGAQGLMVWGAGPAEVILTKQFRAAGLRIPLLMSHAEASYLYLKPVGSAGNGVIVASSIGAVGSQLPSSVPAKAAILSFARSFQAANHYYPPQFALDGYGAIQLIAAAIRAKGPTRAGIAAGLNHLTLTTVEGTYTYTATDHSGLVPKDVVIDRDVRGSLILTAFSRQQLAKEF
jgi:branched-chain amino acid transport system substrate-binding protein